MRNIFDYIYYRAGKYFYKNDGSDSSRALLGLGSSHFLVIFSLGIVLARIFFSFESIQEFLKNYKYLLLSGLAIIHLYNYITYKNKYESLAKKWSDEPVQKSYYRGWAVLIALALPWVLSITILKFLIFLG